MTSFHEYEDMLTRARPDLDAPGRARLAADLVEAEACGRAAAAWLLILIVLVTLIAVLGSVGHP